MLCVPGALDNPETLVGWGGQRRTADDQRRVVAAGHDDVRPRGPLSPPRNDGRSRPVVLVLERLVGSVAFATVYLAAGVLASLVSLSTSAVDVSAGASGAIFGVYGLMSASIMWGALANPRLPIPVVTVNRMVAPAVAFVLYNLANDSIGIPGEVAGFAAGLLGGSFSPEEYPVQASGTAQRRGQRCRPRARARLGRPLRGTGDVRGDIERVVALEARTAGAYNAAVARFRRAA